MFCERAVDRLHHAARGVAHEEVISEERLRLESTTCLLLPAREVRLQYVIGIAAECGDRTGQRSFGDILVFLAEPGIGFERGNQEREQLIL